VDEWRAANDYYYELEESETNIADQIDCRELPEELLPLADEVRADARFRNSFSAVPTRFQMVELDKLIIFQKHVSGHFVQALTRRIGAKPAPEDLFRFCMPLEKPAAPLRVQQVGSRRYLFQSDSLDFRFHESILLQPEQVCGYDSFGAVGGIVGLVVGYSSNLLSAVRSDDRLVLHNGYHRAVALRAQGITHAPCIVETVTRRDELNLVAKRRVAEDPAFYFRSVRPPLLKDFFDPRIRKVLPTRKITRMVEVSFEVSDFTVPE
jgi:hypothetical protein